MMSTRALVIALEGEQAVAAGDALASRLVELGQRVQVLTPTQAEGFGSEEAAGLAADLLVRHDVFVIVLSHKALRASPEYLLVKIDAHDTPDFAAEKILDQLAEAGAVALEQPVHTPEQEERIRERLSKLGYIE